MLMPSLDELVSASAPNRSVIVTSGPLAPSPVAADAIVADRSTLARAVREVLCDYFPGLVTDLPRPY